MKNLVLIAALTLAAATSATAQTTTTARQAARAQRQAARAAAKAAKPKPVVDASPAMQAPFPQAVAAPSEDMVTSAAPVAAPAPAYDKPTKTPQQRADSKVRSMTKDLGLTADQGTKLTPILVEQNTTVDALKEKANAVGKSKDLSQAMRMANQQADEKIKAVLTPEQFATFVKLREERAAAKRAAEGK